MHNFHIPVMGTGFTIDTPLRVAPYGISSVISLVDDQLIEQMYKQYVTEVGISYKEIRRSEHDARARRITRYLNLLEDLIQERFESLKQQEFRPDSELTKYFELLPSSSPLRNEYEKMRKETSTAIRELRQQLLRSKMQIGSIDVNIMTKLDRPQYRNGKIVESELSDAVAALKGFAESSLSSAVVLSAGVNTRLFQAASTYCDFLPYNGEPPKKRLILKVSDYRSALTQGKMLAKKGIWVSEFRVESGLNCGGHAFPTKGELMAVTLDEFRLRRSELADSLFKLYRAALEKRNSPVPEFAPAIRFSAQGGVGNNQEHELLLKNFQLDSVGWGTPFLLVPEVTCVDDETRAELVRAKASDLILSDSSPLGVPFYTLKNSLSEKRRKQKIDASQPGSPCFNKYVALNTEFSGEPLCVASKTYQKKKLAELDSSNLPKDEVERQKGKVLRKACICFDLGAAPRLSGSSEVRASELYPAVCPGPNIAYFNECYSLREMVDHIYGRPSRVKLCADRSHVLLNELELYVEYLQKQLHGLSPTQSKAFDNFRDNLSSGLELYRELKDQMGTEKSEPSKDFLQACEVLCERLKDRDAAYQ